MTAISIVNRQSSIVNRRGFTLIEMLVVIAIISILAGLVLAALASARTTSKINITKANLTVIANALNQYYTGFQDFPPSDGDHEGLKGAANLWKCLTTEQKEGPYINSGDVRTVTDSNGDTRIVDEWNHPIRYLHHNDYGSRKPKPHEYRLISDGPDGIYQEGAPGSDDIVNWKKEQPDQ